MTPTAPPVTVTLPLPTCPRCGQPCPPNELACYRHCEACEVAGLPETPVRTRLADRALPSLAYRREDVRRITNQEVNP